MFYVMKISNNSQVYKLSSEISIECLARILQRIRYVRFFDKVGSFPSIGFLSSAWKFPHGVTLTVPNVFFVPLLIKLWLLVSDSGKQLIHISADTRRSVEVLQKVCGEQKGRLAIIENKEEQEVATQFADTFSDDFLLTGMFQHPKNLTEFIDANGNTLKFT